MLSFSKTDILFNMSRASSGYRLHYKTDACHIMKLVLAGRSPGGHEETSPLQCSIKAHHIASSTNFLLPPGQEGQ